MGKRILSFSCLVAFLLPAARVWAPVSDPLCVTCQATGHELCGREGHHCAHAAVTPAPSHGHCHAAAPAPKPVPSKQTVGHKCPRVEVSSLLAEGAKFVPPQALSAETFFDSGPAVPHAPVFTASFLQKRIDHPPSA
jgi:hypothetical protein